TWRPPIPRTSPREGHTAARNTGSDDIERFRASAFCEQLVIVRDDFLFDHPTRLVIDRMSDILVSAVFAFFAGHRDEKPSGAMYDFQISDHGAVIHTIC